MYLLFQNITGTIGNSFYRPVSVMRTQNEATLLQQFYSKVEFRNKQNNVVHVTHADARKCQVSVQPSHSII